MIRDYNIAPDANISRSKIQGGLGFGYGFPDLEYFVSANSGSDTNYGTRQDIPVATIQQAVDLAIQNTDNLTLDINIYIASGLYTENVSLSRTDAVTGGATSDELLWTAGGTNLGGIGKIRLIATGYVFLLSPALVAQPPLYIGRPNVEVHNFTTIKCNTTVSTHPITKTNWVDADGGTSVHMRMPGILISDDYNNDTLLYGAANSVLISNCKINGGTGSGGILNNGANWIDVVGCTLEYCHEYGVAMVGSSKGFPAELKVYDSRFYQLYSGSMVVHGQAYYMHVDNCRFFDEDPGGEATGGVLNRQASNSNSNSCWITNSHCHSEDDLEGNNTGWDATGIYTAVEGGPVASNDMSTWLDAAA